MPYNRTATDMEHFADREHREKVFDLIAEARFAMFGTYDARGTSHSRPMAMLDREGDALWFMTRAGSRKIDEIERDARVTLDYSEPSDQTYVSLTGRADVLNDRGKIRQLWSEPLRTWFPDGAEDPEIRLIRVVPEEAEYGDSPSSAMVYAFGYLKARFTGEPPKPGDTGHVSMG